MQVGLEDLGAGVDGKSAVGFEGVVDEGAEGVVGGVDVGFEEAFQETSFRWCLWLGVVLRLACWSFGSGVFWLGAGACFICAWVGNIGCGSRVGVDVVCW